MKMLKGKKLRRLLCGALAVAMVAALVVTTGATESVSAAIGAPIPAIAAESESTAEATASSVAAENSETSASSAAAATEAPASSSTGELPAATAAPTEETPASSAASGGTGTPASSSEPSESPAESAEPAPSAAPVGPKLTISGITTAIDWAYDDELPYLEGVTAEAADKTDKNQYRIVVAGVDTPKGGSYTYKDGDTALKTTIDDAGLVYTVHYKVQSSKDGKTWADLTAQPEGLDMTVTITDFATAQEASANGEEIDGVAIQATWNAVTEENTINQVDTTNKISDNKVQAQVTIVTGGDHTYAEGDLTVRIPYVLFSGREDTDFVINGFGVPAKPTKGAASSFWYTIDDKGTADVKDDELVFENYEPISGRNNITLQWSYLYDPWMMDDLSTANVPVVLNATANRGQSSQKITKDTKTLTYKLVKVLGTVVASKTANANKNLIHNDSLTYDYGSDETMMLNYVDWKNNLDMYQIVRLDNGTYYQSNQALQAQTLWGPLPSESDYLNNYWVCWKIPVNMTGGNEIVDYDIQDNLPAGASIYNVTLFDSDMQESYLAPIAGDTARMNFFKTALSQKADYDITWDAGGAISLKQKNFAATSRTGTYGSTTYDFAADASQKITLYVVVRYDKPVAGTPIENSATITAKSITNPANVSEPVTVTGKTTAALTFVSIDKRATNVSKDPTEYVFTWDSKYSVKKNSTYEGIRDGDEMPSSVDFNANTYVGWSVWGNVSGVADGTITYVDDPSGDNGTIIGYYGVGWQWDGNHKFTFTRAASMLTAGSSCTAPLRILVSYPADAGRTHYVNTVTGTLKSMTVTQPDQVLSDTETINFGTRPGAQITLNKGGTGDGFMESGDKILAGNPMTCMSGGRYNWNVDLNYTGKYVLDGNAFVYDDEQLRFNSVNESSSAVHLQSDDYQYDYFYMTYVSGVPSYTDPVTGEATSLFSAPSNAEFMPKIDFWLKINGSWTQIWDQQPMNKAATEMSVRNGKIPEGATAWMINISNLDYVNVNWRVYAGIQVNSTENTRTLMNQVENGGKFYIFNQARAALTGSLRMSPSNANDSSKFVTSVISQDAATVGSRFSRYQAYSHKTVTGGLVADNDTVNRCVRQQITLSAAERVSGYAGTRDMMVDTPNSGYHSEMYFYDLLPYGVTLDKDAAVVGTNVNGGNAANYQASATVVDDNYKNTGRALVRCHVVFVPTTAVPSNYVVSQNSWTGGVWVSGFSVKFTILTPWESLQYLSQDSDNYPNINLAAAQTISGDSFPNQNTTHADTITDGKSDSTITKYFKDFTDFNTGAPVTGCFEDLNGDSDTTTINTIYMAETYRTPTVDLNLLNSLHKYVRAGGGAWSEEAEVEVGDTYNYELLMQASPDGKVKDLVIYDILENAEGTAWKGIFKSINTGEASRAGAKPVVYYSTASGLTYNDFAVESGTKKVDNAAVWTTTCPADLSTIKAIAIDLTKTDSGEDFIMPEKTHLAVTVAMTAAARFTEGEAINQPGLYCTTIPITGTSPVTSFEIANTTAVKLIKPSAIIRVKKVVSNSPGAADAADQYFFINLSSTDGTMDSSISLKDGETSKDMTYLMENNPSQIDVSEIVPMEYLGSYTVTIQNGPGSEATLSGKTVTVHGGDDVTIIVTNEFAHIGYFKSDSTVQNTFTAAAG